MKRRYALNFVASMFAIVCYLAFAILAFSQYPLSFAPMTNWLSHLGSADLNPNGAFFYNIGIIVTGSALILFFLGLSQWKTGNNQKQNILMLMAQGIGILGALAMIMSGFYPITFPDVHGFFSITLFILLGTAFGFSVAALRYHPACPRWLLLLGVVAAVADILSGIFHTAYLLEWVTVALFLLYVGLLGIETNRLTTGTLRQPVPTAAR